MRGNLPPLPPSFSYRLDLSRAATPRLIKNRPRHRWFWFPHSYSPELVEAILDFWELPKESVVFDPFVGAGTTLLVARDRGFKAVGSDLFPLAIRVSKAKVADYDLEHLTNLANKIINTAKRHETVIPEAISERLLRAFTKQEYAVLHTIKQSILEHTTSAERDFFLLALLATAKTYSRAVADGGWFRWVDRPETSPEVLIRHFEACVQSMLADVTLSPRIGNSSVAIYQNDARHLERLPGHYNALITSPPYPNRHDYTRVFHIELLLLGESETSIKQLRHNSIRSHVEAKTPSSLIKNGYREPETLRKCLSKFPAGSDTRVLSMLRGYFEDLYCVLYSAQAILAPGAKLAFVVGNVRHAGVLIPVDEILAEVGIQAGYKWTGTWVIRLRGNSAQQMGRLGRVPSRESIVFLEK